MTTCYGEWLAQELDRRIEADDAAGLVECRTCNRTRRGGGVCERCDNDICKSCYEGGVRVCGRCAEAEAIALYDAADAAWDEADALQAARAQLVAAGFPADAVAMVDQAIDEWCEQAERLWDLSVVVGEGRGRA